MRSRYSGRTESERSSGSGSDRSYQTQPTEYSGSPVSRPEHVHYKSHDGIPAHVIPRFFEDRDPQSSPRASVETYASTVDSENADEEYVPEYDSPSYDAEICGDAPLVATPADFSELFPSRRRLLIHHDDSTFDGNMNLRVDTDVYVANRRCDMTLFHLRMHDLKAREFSFRRYCRDSGREVCHSTGKQQNTATAKRPGFQRSLSNALTNMSIRPKSESRAPTLESLKRNDSGYGSLHSLHFNEDERPRSAGHGAQPRLSNDTIRLEFSNYAQVDVKRIGSGTSKRYEFQYWGVPYTWRRVERKSDGLKEVAFHLTRQGSDRELAYITPLALSPSRAQEERSRGGWIPPCSMWLADESLVRGQKDAVE
jgi:hypothetical protein